MIKFLKTSFPLFSLGLSVVLSFSAIYYEFLHEENSRRRYNEHSETKKNDEAIRPSNRKSIDNVSVQTESSGSDDRVQAPVSVLAKENARLREQIGYKLEKSIFIIDEQRRRPSVEKIGAADVNRHKGVRQDSYHEAEESLQEEIASHIAEKKERLRLIQSNTKFETASQQADAQECLRLEKQRRHVEKDNRHAEELERIRLDDQRRQVEKANHAAEEKELLRLQKITIDDGRLPG